MNSNQVVTFDAPQLPPALLSQDALGLGKALTGGLGAGINRISLKGNRFRLLQAGQEIAVLEQSDLDVVIVGSTNSVSRLYYKEKYNSGQDKVKPTCWSHDGVKPDGDVPGDQKQSTACASCQQNIKGSAVGDNGAQSRACAFRKRIVVVPPSQLGDGETPEAYALDVNALSLFGDGLPNQNKYSLGGYGKFLSTPRNGFASGIPPIAVITRLTLDSNSSVPKLFFGVGTNDAGRASFLSTEQINAAMVVAKSADVARLVTVSASDLIGGEELHTQAAASTTSAASPTPPPLPPVKSWQEVATEAGVDDDDIEMIEAAGGPYTVKGRARWDKFIDGIEPPASAGKTEAPVAEKSKAAKPKAKPEATDAVVKETKKANPFAAAPETPAPAPAASIGKKNPFGSPPAPATASAPAKPQGVSAEVGAKLAGKLAEFDDE